MQGGPSGLRQKPSQIILASDIPGPSISTLGYSLSGGLDMDFNNHTDLLVGAYESDTVVILRARPVIDIVTWFGNKTVRINPSKLGCDMDPTSEEVCFQVNFTHLTQYPCPCPQIHLHSCLSSHFLHIGHQCSRWSRVSKSATSP